MHHSVIIMLEDNLWKGTSFFSYHTSSKAQPQAVRLGGRHGDLIG